MKKLNVTEPKIDPVFSRLIPKHSVAKEELPIFNERLEKEKGFASFVVWKEKNILLTDVFKFKICKEYQIPYEVIYLSFPNHKSAKEWIGNNLLQKLNLNNWQRGKLAIDIWQKDFESQAKANKSLSKGRGKKGRKESDELFESMTVNQRLASKAGLSSDTIGKIKAVLSFQKSKIKNISDVIEKLETGEVSISQANYEVKRIKRKKDAPNPGKYTNNLSKGVENNVVCMDVLKAMKLVPDNSVSLVFTSPPFQVDMTYADGISDTIPWSKYLPWMKNVFKSVYPKLRRGGKLVIEIEEITTREAKDKKIEIRRPTIGELQFMMRDIGYVYLGNIIWNKGKVGNNFGPWKSCGYPSDADIKPMHSNLLIWTKEQKELPCVTNDLSELSKEELADLEKSVWRVVPSQMHKTIHACPFPVELAERVVRFFSHKQDVCMDIFGGSGTVAVSCIRNQRRFIHVDASQTYCKEAKEWIQQEQKAIAPKQTDVKAA